MRIDFDERTVSASVREVAEFRTGPTDRTATGAARWRTDIGQVWHQALAERTAAEVATDSTRELSLEVTVKGQLRLRDWLLTIEGRIDQLLRSPEAVTIREVKTVGRDLPADPDELLAAYPHYLAQLGGYLALAANDGAFADEDVPLRGVLVFVDYRDGVVQVIPGDKQATEAFTQRCHDMVTFAEHRRSARRVLRDVVDVPQPFETFRDGQQDALTALLEAPFAERTTLFQAPTGFGKSAFAVHWALEHLVNRGFNRIIYATAKSTGQIEALKQFTHIRDQIGTTHGLPAFRVCHLRGKAEVSRQCPVGDCDAGRGCRENIEDRWDAAGLSAWKLLAGGHLGHAEMHRVSANSGVCPYELVRSALPFAEVWVCDVNYVFSPRNRALFDAVPGFSAKDTVLVVDEAHNLPGRVEDCLSFRLEGFAVETLVTELTFARASGRLLQPLRELADFAGGVRPCDRLAELDVRELVDLLEAVAEAVMAEPLDSDLVPPAVLDAIWGYPWMAEALKRGVDPEPPHTPALIWSPERGAVAVSCLDPAPWTAPVIAEFGASLMMSATLEPFDDFRQRCGLDEATCNLVIGEAPWRKNAYRIAVDTRIDTRFRAREKHHQRLAQVIARLAIHDAPVCVFFPSYRYAREVASWVEADPVTEGTRLAVQESGLSLDGQRAFLEEAVLQADAIFLVLGGSFAEGIDFLGGRVSLAAIVSPALPEVNAIQKARLEGYGEFNRDDGFRSVYQIPGMRKVNQAIGRLVRAPGHRASIVLVGKRFAEASYRNLLLTADADLTIVDSDDAFSTWLAG